MKNTIAILVTLALVLSGCAANLTSVTSKNGQKYRSKNNEVLNTVTGYTNSMTNSDGTSSTTSVQNLAGDVQMVQALGAAGKDLISAVGPLLMMAMGNTNSLSGISSNLVSIQKSQAAHEQFLMLMDRRMAEMEAKMPTPGPTVQPK